MTSSPSSPPSAAAGLASSIVVYILYTCACTHNKQTVFFHIISRSVGRAVLNFYLAISIIYMLAQCVCYVFTLRQTVGKQHTPALSLLTSSYLFFFPVHNNLLAATTLEQPPKRAWQRRGGECVWQKGSPLSASTSPLTVMWPPRCAVIMLNTTSN